MSTKAQWFFDILACFAPRPIVFPCTAVMIPPVITTLSLINLYFNMHVYLNTNILRECSPIQILFANFWHFCIKRLLMICEILKCVKCWRPIIVGFFIPVSSLKVFGHSTHSKRRWIYLGKSIQAIQNDTIIISWVFSFRVIQPTVRWHTFKLLCLFSSILVHHKIFSRQSVIKVHNQ